MDLPAREFRAGKLRYKGWVISFTALLRRRCLYSVLGLLVTLLVLAAASARAQSVFSRRPNDPNAVYLQRGTFGAEADGKADDTRAIQAAIDRVQETTGQGIVFVAEGRYRISATIHLWTGIRLIGYGMHRPVFVLGPNTPGYQEGHGFLGTGRYMLQFASRRPRPGAAVVDANEFTFYSGIRNIDFQIEDGNPAAIAIRFHVAQHSYLEDINFRVGQGRAAIEDVGNNASHLHIEGGDYGIISVRTAPGWQFLLLDSTIEGQRKAAIHTQEVGMTLVRDHIAHTPVAVEITKNMAEQLYGRDLTLQDIGQSALVLGDVHKALHEVTLDHVVCNNVVRLVEGGEGVRGFTPVPAPAKHYFEEHLTIGLEIGPHGRERGIVMHHKESLAATPRTPVTTDLPALPPMRDWVNVRTLGVKGDGGADDTAALQRAIDRHRVLYFPSGTYRLTNTLRLRRNTVLIGFNPATTVITIWDNEAAFMGDGPPVPLIQSARGGNAILSGIGIDTGFTDPRASGLEWRAGPHSMVDDVNFARGHGSFSALLAPKMPRPPRRRFFGGPDTTASTQYPSLWVHDGGGGLFRGIWTSNTGAKAGLLVENTQTPGIIYQMSCEHHMHHETQFHHVSNWTVYALQTEEENPAGAKSFSVELEDAHNILFGNLFVYRVSRTVLPKLSAVETANSSGISFENVHNFSQTRLAYDNSILDRTTGLEVRSHDFTTFTLTADSKPGAPLPLPAGVFAPDAKLERLATGFSNASGLTADKNGRIFFTDAAMHKVYGWDAAAKQAKVVTDTIEAPMAVAAAGPESLLAVNYGRSAFRRISPSVFSVNPQTGAAVKVAPKDTPEAGTRLLLPVGLHNSMDTLIMQMEHRGVVYAPGSNMAIVARVTDQPRDYFYAPGTPVAIMAGGNWLPMLECSQWRVFDIGDEHLAVSEDDDTTYRLKLNSLRGITATAFLPRGGTSVVTDKAGNIYVAEGQLYIYNAQGKQIGVVEIPERPSSLAFGGSDRRTLFVGARSSLFSIRTLAAGN